MLDDFFARLKWFFLVSASSSMDSFIKLEKNLERYFVLMENGKKRKIATNVVVQKESHKKTEQIYGNSVHFASVSLSRS